MKVVRWSFSNLHMPMMVDGAGELWCTSSQLCSALGITEAALRWTKKRHIDEFDDGSVTKNHAKDFFLENKVEFGITRVRADMSLWSEDDMITVAILSKSDKSKEFRKEFKKFVKENAKREFLSDHVHKEELNESKREVNRVLIENGKLYSRLDALENFVYGSEKPIKLQLVR